VSGGAGATASPGPEATGPLKGLRVIELGVLLAGPFCGQLLGDLGAEVIKIEPPGQPDPLRAWGTVRPAGEGLWFPIVARNKRCATLDLRQSDGQELLKRLVATADILVENFRPGTLEKWGLSPDVLLGINPGLIIVRVSGYGQTGPYAGRAGYASVGEAMGGLRYVIGDPDRTPSRAGISLGDSLAATFGALGALAALEHRRQTGQGQVVDTSIYESVLAMMECLVPDYALGGHVRERTGPILPKIAPSNIYRAADGMVVIAANQDSVFARLCTALGHPEWTRDPRFATHHARGENQAELDSLIEAWSSVQTMDQLEAACEAEGVPFGRVYRAPDMLADPHFQARQSIIEAMHPVLGAFPVQNVFPRLSATPGQVRWLGRDQGADTGWLWGEVIGLSDAELARLKSSGTI
jgi:formyl-CoA transferase